MIVINILTTKEHTQLSLKIMECNKDEAIRAKAIAEKKLGDKDFAGAKKFTLKAQNLYPGLDGVSHMLITLNVYISSEKKVNGECDWYGILDVNPSDDDETIRKQYRKLALMLHPDKNNSVGADGAFKIISEAWSLLSDKAKRSAYNQRRNARVFQQKSSPQSWRPSSSSFPGVNGFHASINRTTSRPKTCPPRASPSVPPRPRPQPQPRPQPRPPAPNANRGDTFWTMCHRCEMNYEYIKVYLNKTILCPGCHKAFFAAEMPVPLNFPKQAAKTTGRSPPNIRFSRTNLHCNAGPSVELKTGDFVKKFNEKLKRDADEYLAHCASKRRRGEDGGESSNVKAPYHTSARN